MLLKELFINDERSTERHNQFISITKIGSFNSVTRNSVKYRVGLYIKSVNNILYLCNKPTNAHWWNMLYHISISTYMFRLLLLPPAGFFTLILTYPLYHMPIFKCWELLYHCNFVLSSLVVKKAVFEPNINANSKQIAFMCVLRFHVNLWDQTGTCCHICQANHAL